MWVLMMSVSVVEDGSPFPSCSSAIIIYTNYKNSLSFEQPTIGYWIFDVAIWKGC